MKCPLCKRMVKPTIRNRVPRHHNTIGRWCEVSGENYKIVEVGAE